MNHFRGVEQLAARQAHNLEVAGSSPAPATIPVTPWYVLTRTFYAALRHLGGIFLNIELIPIRRLTEYFLLPNVNIERSFT